VIPMGGNVVEVPSDAEGLGVLFSSVELTIVGDPVVEAKGGEVMMEYDCGYGVGDGPVSALGAVGLASPLPSPAL
jgi:hypothetical protein